MCTADSRGRDDVCQAANCSCVTILEFVVQPVSTISAIYGLEGLGVFIGIRRLDVLSEGRWSGGA